MKGAMLRRWLLSVVLLVFAVSCNAKPKNQPDSPTAQVPSITATSTDSTSSKPTSSAPGDSAFDAVVSLIGPKGEVSPEMALQAFSLAVAPLPRVTPPTGSPSNLDADLAVKWVSEVWDQLSSEQQTAINKALEVMSDPYFESSANSANPANITQISWHSVIAATDQDCGLFLADSGEALNDIPVSVQGYVDMMKSAAGAIASHLGRPSLQKLAVCLMPSGTLSAPALTRLFDAEHTQLGLPVSCSIFLNSDTVNSLGDGDLGYMMAYKTFNCFAPTADPSETLASFSARRIAPWVRGGAASWAGATVAIEVFGGAGDRLNELWSVYLTEPEATLFQRTNDAIGFFAQVDQNQPSAWGVIDDALLAGDSVGSFYAMTGRRQSFIDQWASGYFRDASRGPDWDILGPAIPSDTAEAGSIEVANGERQEMAATALSVSIADLSTSADITVLAGNHLRIHDGVQDFKDVHNQAYCTKEGGSDACVCPKGSQGEGRPALPTLNVEAKLALTGVEMGGTATIQGMSLEEYCGPQPTPESNGNLWSYVFWSPDLGDSVPPIMAAYTCDGLASTWKVIFLPGDSLFEWSFELPFGENLEVHLDKHYDIPADKQSKAQGLDYALDFFLDTTTDIPVIRVSGTKTESEGSQSIVLQPREFSSDSPIELKNVSLETLLLPYPNYQHPFREQALAECGN